MFHQVFQCLQYRSIEIKHDVHRRKDYMRKFCELLREHVMKMINFNPVQDEKSPPPNQFFPCNFYKRKKQLSKLPDFQFQPYFHNGIKFQGHILSQPQTTELELRLPLKKIVFSSHILKNKVEVILTFCIEMLELPTFGHMTTSTIKFELHDKILLVTLF